MLEFLKSTIGKFTFRVAKDRYYSIEGLWVVAEGHAAHIGVTDYLQQRSGDMAFAEVKPVGITLAVGDELATLETIKVNTSLSSPVSGTVAQINLELASTPELINTDPYGAGWLVVIDMTNWESERAGLLTAEQYFEQMKAWTEQDMKKL